VKQVKVVKVVNRWKLDVRKLRIPLTDGQEWGCGCIL